MSTRIAFADTGDFLDVADLRELGNEAERERAKTLGLQFAREPTSALAARLVALLGRQSSLAGNVRDPAWLSGLSAAHRVVVMQELQQLVGS
jgi:hypothetical protein